MTSSPVWNNAAVWASVRPLGKLVLIGAACPYACGGLGTVARTGGSSAVRGVNWGIDRGIGGADDIELIEAVGAVGCPAVAGGAARNDPIIYKHDADGRPIGDVETLEVAVARVGEIQLQLRGSVAQCKAQSSLTLECDGGRLLHVEQIESRRSNNQENRQCDDKFDERGSALASDTALAARSTRFVKDHHCRTRLIWVLTPGFTERSVSVTSTVMRRTPVSAVPFMIGAASISQLR
jgi:hypothetical protein